jgi:hypothetical protein
MACGDTQNGRDEGDRKLIEVGKAEEDEVFGGSNKGRDGRANSRINCTFTNWELFIILVYLPYS